jgi:hypothetical protein
LKHPAVLRSEPQRSSPKYITKTSSFPLPFWKKTAVLGALWIASFVDPACARFKRPAENNIAQSNKREKVDGRQANHGATTRKNYSYEFRARIMDMWFLAHDGNQKLTQESFCTDVSLNQSLLSKWLKNQKRIYEYAAKAR